MLLVKNRTLLTKKCLINHVLWYQALEQPLPQSIPPLAFHKAIITTIYIYIYVYICVCIYIYIYTVYPRNYEQSSRLFLFHDDAIKWKHFPCYWPFVRGIHRSPVNSPHKGQWRGALMSSLIYAWINGWVNNREAGDLGRHRAHPYVTVMLWFGTTGLFY